MPVTKTMQFFDIFSMFSFKFPWNICASYYRSRKFLFIPLNSLKLPVSMLAVLLSKREITFSRMHLRSLTEADLHIMVIHDKRERSSNIHMPFPLTCFCPKKIDYLFYLYIVSLPIQKFPLFYKKSVWFGSDTTLLRPQTCQN